MFPCAKLSLAQAMRKEIFEKGQYYHIYDRGVDRRQIFLDDRDRTRFVHAMYILNNFLEIPFRFDLYHLEPQKLLTPIEPYVEIVAGCLMSNHYHLMVTPLRKNGISSFFHKVGTSYTKYFNIKHERTGRLFSSTFKAKHVDKQEYAAYLTQYIHLNPVELCQAKLGTKEKLEKIEKYPWSTLPDYIGSKSKLSLLLSKSGNFRSEVLDLTAGGYQKFLYELGCNLCQA